MYLAIWNEGEWETPNGEQALPTPTIPRAYVVAMLMETPWNATERITPKAQTAPGLIRLRVTLT